MKYNPIVGLEIHVELKTKSKMFCSCKNDPNERHPNVNICPICTAQPGSLPVINGEAVRKTIKTGLALNCKIPETSKFDRKNYFYPDLPKGYQISQYDKPFCKNGYLEIGEKKIRITRVHLEEDTGRLIHSGDSSLVDFNRAGIPLMELVTEPDLNSAKEARRFAEELQLILRYLGVSDADMEKAQLRVEVNISLSQGQKLGTKVEIKNLNSFRAVERAIDYEVERQTEILDKGKKVVQETRGWDETKGITVSQREKEEAHDYRYFPEPDLPTLHLDKKFIQEIKVEIPELPQQRRGRLAQEYNLDEKSIEIFTFYKYLGEYFEKVMSELRNWVKEIETKEKVGKEEFLELTKFAVNYIITGLQGLLKRASVIEGDFLITPENFAEFVTLIYEGRISSKIAKTVLEEMFKTGADPSHIIEEKGLTQLTDTGEIEKIIKEVISKNPKAIKDYKKGKENALQFLVGQVMAATRGRAKPDTVQQLLKKFL
ncbi:Asp-tRNA(Asn)/Glu-tRNA(Gln) amidotransferase subunit GatB [Patescibacteria group bacterium]|nr:Asp-tRNA(Asn)/Glu-tRNA(Gln) amidotransferase subunit GatB [Patescibacteria group bacterium]